MGLLALLITSRSLKGCCTILTEHSVDNVYFMSCLDIRTNALLVMCKMPYNVIISITVRSCIMAEWNSEFANVQGEIKFLGLEHIYLDQTQCRKRLDVYIHLSDQLLLWPTQPLCHLSPSERQCEKDLDRVVPGKRLCRTSLLGHENGGICRGSITGCSRESGILAVICVSPHFLFR